MSRSFHFQFNSSTYRTAQRKICRSHRHVLKLYFCTFSVQYLVQKQYRYMHYSQVFNNFKLGGPQTTKIHRWYAQHVSLL